jgi:DNA-binding NtrC family response regulator
LTAALATILVVEDNALIRADMADQLTAAGYATLEAENADVAISILQRRQDIRVVFTDVDMPGSMDGVKLAHYVADRWPPVKLLVTSGHVNITLDQLPSGAEFCAKPCPPGRMMSIIAGLLAEAGGWQ